MVTFKLVGDSLNGSMTSMVLDHVKISGKTDNITSNLSLTEKELKEMVVNLMEIRPDIFEEISVPVIRRLEDDNDRLRQQVEDNEAEIEDLRSRLDD